MKHISKSSYLIGLECPKYLWVKFNDPSKIPKPNNENEYQFEVGRAVGELAKSLYPDGIDIPEKDFKVNLEESKKLLSKRKPLFEVAFSIDKLYSRADVLVPVEKDKWDIVEVKSATKVKDVNIQDVSFQRYVYEKAGIKIRKCFLMHINNQYVKNGEIEPKELFVQTDITEEVDEAIKGIEERIARMFEIVKSKKCPEISCEDIANVVYGNFLIDEFYDSLPEENVFELYNIRKKKAIEIYEEGIKCIRDIPESFKLNAKQKIQRACAIEKRKHVDKDKIKGFLGELKYPLYYLDFETLNNAIPRFDGTKPYHQIPFQYSLHVVEEEGADPKHISFLADGIDDPRPKFMQSLKENLGDKGSIIVYYESFEKSRLKESAEAFPEFSDWSEKIIKRIIDLRAPFFNFYYYDPKQKGSNSIKNILPVMSDLSYKHLDIDNGVDASIEFERIMFGDVGEKERKKVRVALEKYCELDTLAEILIVERLIEIVKD